MGWLAECDKHGWTPFGANMSRREVWCIKCRYGKKRKNKRAKKLKSSTAIGGRR